MSRSTIRRFVLCLCLCLLPLSGGCSALIGAGIREAFDHGSKPRYQKRSYWGHVRDIQREQRERCCCRRRSCRRCH